MVSYRVEIATEASGARDVPVADISGDLAQLAGGSFVRAARGYDKAVIGADPRAGDLAARLENVGLLYNLYQPRPGLAVRLTKTVSGTDYPLWQGNIDSPEQEMAPAPAEFRPVIQTAALGVLSRVAGRKVTTQLYENITTGQAIGFVLDAAEFPASLRDLDAGVVTLPYFWGNGDDALDLIRKVRQSEGITSDLYEDGQGRIVFRDRNARFVEARSATPQSVFTSEGAEPRLTGLTWVPDYREIVNDAEHPRHGYSVAASTSVVWTDPVGLYILLPGQVLALDATAAAPFKGAITPVEGTDYSVGYGSVTVAINRTSGQTVRITFTAGAVGALLGGDPGGAYSMQLRAVPLTLSVEAVEHNGVDASASIADFGLLPWDGSMWPVMDWGDMRDDLDAIVTWFDRPVGRMTFGVLANRGTAAQAATAARDIGDRVTVIEPDLGIDLAAYIERIEHEINAPARHFALYECSTITVPLEIAPEETTHGPTFLSGSRSPLGVVNYEQRSPGSRRMVMEVDGTTYGNAWVFDMGEVLNHWARWNSTDAGANWPARTVVSAAGSTQVAYDMYYARWTAPSLPNVVLMSAYRDAGTRGLYATVFDLTTETVLSDQLVAAGGASPTANAVFAVVAKSGRMYVGAESLFGGLDAIYYSDDGGATWTTTGVAVPGAWDDRIHAWPLIGGDDPNDFLFVWHDQSAGTYTFGKYDAGAPSTSTFGTVFTGMPTWEGTGLHWAPLSSMTMNPATGDLYIAAQQGFDGAADVILTALLTPGGTITAKTSVITADWLLDPALVFVGGSVYAFYGRDPTATSYASMSTFYKVSTDGMVTWGAETPYAADDGQRQQDILHDPIPLNGIIMPGVHRYATDDIYFTDAIIVATGGDAFADHGSNPFDDLDNGASTPGSSTGVDDQGMMMRGLVVGALMGVEDID